MLEACWKKPVLYIDICWINDGEENIKMCTIQEFWNPDTFPKYFSSWMHVENMSESNFSPKSSVAHNLECRIPIFGSWKIVKKRVLWHPHLKKGQKHVPKYVQDYSNVHWILTPCDENKHQFPATLAINNPKPVLIRKKSNVYGEVTHTSDTTATLLTPWNLDYNWKVCWSPEMYPT